ncbi:MAG: hypothetical protein R2802_11590 [Flavobacteriaceae bacterium]|nr:hypothetical protein [Mangrovimonas sp.]MCB0470254.1 hypothetical protein [Flavobacteriaceae bacterium]MCB0434247.1 hypothetical protein [Mangrovimonas sp.]MCB0435564.1 hypothetical protein [Mangrovimonas sp.]MCB0437737.1 hypothetical protein [Mangrovimonas sp.]
MKLPVMFYVWVTTLLLVTVTIMASMNMPFSWVFYLVVLGQILVVLMVYRVLTDSYKTTKTFQDFYEDYPIGREEI